VGAVLDAETLDLLLEAAEELEEIAA